MYRTAMKTSTCTGTCPLLKLANRFLSCWRITGYLFTVSAGQGIAEYETSGENKLGLFVSVCVHTPHKQANIGNKHPRSVLKQHQSWMIAGDLISARTINALLSWRSVCLSPMH